MCLPWDTFLVFILENVSHETGRDYKSSNLHIRGRLETLRQSETQTKINPLLSVTICQSSRHMITQHPASRYTRRYSLLVAPRAWRREEKKMLSTSGANAWQQKKRSPDCPSMINDERRYRARINLVDFADSGKSRAGRPKPAGTHKQ